MKTALIAFDRETVRTLIPDPKWWNIRGTKRWTTYRLFDAAGNVIYSGATGDPRQRILKHIASPDKSAAVQVLLEFHQSSTKMSEREAELIAANPTALNSTPQQRHGTWKARRSVVAV